MRCLLGLLLVRCLAAQPVPQLMREFQHERALQRIEARLPLGSSSERARLLLWKAECLIELDRPEQAEPLLNSLPKDKPQFFLLRARLARAQGHDDLAIQDLNHLVQGPPSQDSCEAALYLATLYAETGRSAECDDTFSRCLEIIGDLPDRQLNWQKIYYQRASQLEKAARIPQAIDWCRLGSRHCERVQPGSSVPLRSLEAILLGRLQKYEQADQVWSRLIQPDSGKVKPLVAWGYDMLYQRSDRQGILNWLRASDKVMATRLEPSIRLHLLILKAQIFLYRLHDYPQAEATLRSADPLAPNRPHTVPGGWRVSLRFHPYGPEPTSELEWICWMRLEAMQRRHAPDSDIQSFIAQVAPRLRPEERAPWLFQLTNGSAQALSLSQGLQRSKLLVSMMAKGEAKPEQWQESLSQLSSTEAQQARQFLLEQASDTAMKLTKNSQHLETLAEQYLEPLQLEEMVTKLEARQDLNRLTPLLQRRIQRLFLEGRLGEALANSYRMLAWGERDHQLNLQAGALWNIARVEAEVGRLERACQMIEKSRQLRISAEERPSELSTARAQITLLNWAGHSEKARQLASQYSLTYEAHPQIPRKLVPLPLTDAAPFLAACSRLAVDYPQFPTTIAMLPSRMVELRPLLGPDQVLVQIFTGPQETVVLTATREGFTFQRLLVSRELLEDWVRTMRGQLRAPLDPALADAVHALLLQSLNLKDRRVILVCPGLLQDLPWDLLHPDWKCWWLWAGEAGQPYPSPAEPRVLALGDVPGLDLPATRLEVEQLNQIFPSQLLLGPQATRAALERFAPGSDIIHLATHASLDRQPDRAQLALADGAYTARQVFACPLKPGALVVLSACDTANSRAQDRAPTTLANAFLAAGASQVVATLAPVEDEAARRFFVNFYGHLKAGQPPAQALQLAKKDHQNDPDRTWASFVLLGGCP